MRLHRAGGLGRSLEEQTRARQTTVQLAERLDTTEARVAAILDLMQQACEEAGVTLADRPEFRPRLTLVPDYREPA